jgi:hypothetical protein
MKINHAKLKVRYKNIIFSLYNCLLQLIDNVVKNIILPNYSDIINASCKNLFIN